MDTKPCVFILVRHGQTEWNREVIHLFVKEITIGENEVHIAYRFSFPKKPTSGKSIKKCNPKKPSIRDLGQQPAFVEEPVKNNEILDNKKNVGLVMVPKGGVEPPLEFSNYALNVALSLIHISEPTRLGMISYA